VSPTSPGGIVKRIPAYAGMTSPLRRQGLAMVFSRYDRTIPKAFGLEAATQRHHCHSRAGGNPVMSRLSWTPAFAGVTTQGTLYVITPCSLHLRLQRTNQLGAECHVYACVDMFHFHSMGRTCLRKRKHGTRVTEHRFLLATKRRTDITIRSHHDTDQASSFSSRLMHSTMQRIVW
jgi:hypothetical protein